jgi:uncharacterized delta-60 repeat protein
VAWTTVGAGDDAEATSVVQASDGRLLVGGFGEGSDNVTTQPWVARFTSTGTLDTATFAAPKGSTTMLGTTGRPIRVAVGSDGSAALLLGEPTAFTVQRFRANGEPDTSFDSDGRTTVDWGAQSLTTVLLLDAAGRVLVAGAVERPAPSPDYGSRVPVIVTRLTAAGALDPTFGDGGFAEAFGGGRDFAIPWQLVPYGADRLMIVGQQNDLVGPTATNRGPSGLALARMNVAPGRPPEVTLSADPRSPLTGQTVSLIASASDPDPGGTVDRYEWDFDNDGLADRTTAAPGTTISYATPGTRTVRVRAVDEEGLAGEATIALDVVDENVPPFAAFRVVTPNPRIRRPVEFDASISRDFDGRIVRYEFDLDGDGAFETDAGPRVSHVYPRADRVAVGLRVTDDRGAVDRTTLSVRVLSLSAAQARRLLGRARLLVARSAPRSRGRVAAVVDLRGAVCACRLTATLRRLSPGVPAAAARPLAVAEFTAGAGRQAFVLAGRGRRGQRLLVSVSIVDRYANRRVLRTLVVLTR